MNETQREAALRLIAEHPMLFMNDLPDWCDDAFHLLRELAATVAENATVEPVAYVDPRQLARKAAVLHCITRPEYRSWSDAAAGLEYTPVYLHPPQQGSYSELAEQCERYATRIMELEKALGECTGALQTAGHPIEWQRKIDRAVIDERERCASLLETSPMSGGITRALAHQIRAHGIIGETTCK